MYARAIAFTVGILVKHGTAARRQCKEPRWLRVRALRSKTRKVEGHTDMSAIPAPQRIELTPAVRAILEADTPKSQLLRHFLRFTEAIVAPDSAGIDRVVTPDARFHELEAIGYPRGPEGFKMFRRQVNAAIPDEHIFVTAVRFEGDDIIEADLDISATHTGEEFMGIPATRQKIRFDVHTRGRFVGGKMAERWDRADFEDIKRQLTGTTQ